MDTQRRTEAVEHLEAQNATEAEAGRQLARSLQRHLRQHLDAMGLPPTRLWWSELLPMGAAAMRARDRAVPAVGRAVADGRGCDEARDRAVLAERGHPAGNGKGGRKGGGKAGGKHNEDPAARGRRGGRRHRRGDGDLGALLRAVLNRRR